MKNKPDVGDNVTLNSNGLNTIGGLRSWETVNQALLMKITKVSENLTTDIPTYNIEVNQPLINKFMITNHDVDLY